MGAAARLRFYQRFTAAAMVEEVRTRYQRLLSLRATPVGISSELHAK